MKKSKAQSLFEQGQRHLAQGQLLAAERLLRQALSLDPLCTTCNSLGNVLAIQGKFKEAEQCYLQLLPTMTEVFNNLGNVLAAQGKWEEAIACYQNMLKHHPDSIQAWHNLGDALAQVGKWEEALTCFQSAVQKESNQGVLWQKMADAAFQLKKWELATNSYQKALESGLIDEYIYGFTGHAYLMLGKLNTARLFFEKALAHTPNSALGLKGLAEVLERQGKPEEAYETLKPTIFNDPLPMKMTYVKTCLHLEKYQEAEDVLVPLQQSQELTSEEQKSVFFRLGDLRDRQGHYEQAFGYYSQANQLANRQFEPEAHRKLIDHLMAQFLSERLSHSNQNDDRPVFIVGMPRSGTSLVEQILASHPNIYGAGELPLIEQIYQSLNQTSDLDALATSYLAYLDTLSNTAQRITDKMPGNFLHLGLIATLFPATRIIHCIRNPLDTCLSCFFQDFAKGHDYTYNLAHLGHFYRQYQRIMTHWKQVLTIPILDVKYEELIENPEKISRQMIAFCALPWDDRCLSFYQSSRFVNTASYRQVRQPIYHSSVNRYRHYEKHLKPLGIT